ncbi:energy-coupling factor ABC transporter ATP-binding protein [Methanothermococcus sp.]|uniref:energy-coupling factor ABC transporter ATP-binding protein n=1 Tax=Methanothermococcus sp. TaxID=2614238 RepID=UPI0025CFD694|nr:energy-coupling factor ABC transporter ATP-binding protein [Methanothermococcus sp.]
MSENINNISNNIGINNDNVNKNINKEIIFKLKNVSYKYPDGTLALDKINMEVYRGEILAIIGSNGAGKTTLLKILNGLEFPSNGEVYFEGKKLTEKILTNKESMKYFRSRVGFVFQDPDIMLFSPTVWDDVAFGPLHLYSKEKAINSTDKTLKDMNIYKLKDKHPYNISGGEKKKASIASVMSIEPEVILMDEPTSYLDPKSKKYIIQLIKKLNKMGKTIVFVSHDPNLISVADMCYVLNKKIIFSGYPRDVFSNVELLERENLDVPEITKLFKKIKDDLGNNNIDKIPINIDEGYELLKSILNNVNNKKE